MKKSENLFWAIAGLISFIFWICISPLFFCQMDFINGKVSSISKNGFPPRFFIENSDYEYRTDSRANDSIVYKMHRGDTVEVWFYRQTIRGTAQHGHFIGGPYEYLVTQLKVNGEMKIEYSFMLTNWLNILFWLIITVYNTIRFIQKTKNNGTKEKEMLTKNQKVSISRRLPK